LHAAFVDRAERNQVPIETYRRVCTRYEREIAELRQAENPAPAEAKLPNFRPFEIRVQECLETYAFEWLPSEQADEGEIEVCGVYKPGRNGEIPLDPTHRVGLWSDGRVTCDCKHMERRDYCKHGAAVLRISGRAK
jgi:hypothetical protein